MHFLRALFRLLSEYRSTFASLLILAGVFGFMWWLPATTDFGLNAFTETVGIILTVFVVDQLIKQQDTRRQIPVHNAAYLDIREILLDLSNLWAMAYSNSVSSDVPDTYERLFSAEVFDQIGHHLDLEYSAPVTPSRSWQTHLVTESRSIRSKAERLLERYAATLDPQAYALVHRVSNGFVGHTGPQILEGMAAADREMGFPRAPTLRARWFASQESFHVLDPEAVIALHAWAVQEKQQLEKQGVESVPEPSLSKGFIPKEPPARITEEKLENYARRLYEFRQRSE